MPANEKNDTNELLPSKCAECGKSIVVKPSIFMTDLNLNRGSGTCPFCKTFLHLELSEDKKSIISERWDIWRDKELKKEGIEIDN